MVCSILLLHPGHLLSQPMTGELRVVMYLPGNQPTALKLKTGRRTLIKHPQYGRDYSKCFMYVYEPVNPLR